MREAGTVPGSQLCDLGPGTSLCGLGIPVSSLTRTMTGSAAPTADTEQALRWGVGEDSTPRLDLARALLGQSPWHQPTSPGRNAVAEG